MANKFWFTKMIKENGQQILAHKDYQGKWEGTKRNSGSKCWFTKMFKENGEQILVHKNY